MKPSAPIAVLFAMVLAFSTSLAVPASADVVLESGEFSPRFVPTLGSWVLDPIDPPPGGADWAAVYTGTGLDATMSNGERVSEAFETRFAGYNCCFFVLLPGFGTFSSPELGPLEIDVAALQAQLNQNAMDSGGLSIELIETTSDGVQSIPYADGPDGFQFEVLDTGSGTVIQTRWSGWDGDDSFIEEDSTYRVRISGNPCARGTVNAGNGFLTNALFLQGSTGGQDRTVEIAEGDLFEVTLLQPFTGGNGKFVLHANTGSLASSNSTPLPFGIGDVCFPLLTSDGAAPVIVANNIGKPNQLGESHYFGVPTADPETATTSFLYPNLPIGTTLTFQGVIVDPGSTSPRAVSTTNAVVLAVR